jgi:hypothetical protein
MKRKSIAEQWDDFSLRVGLYNVSPIQRQEMRRAFYGGAASILSSLVMGLDEDHEPTEEDMEYISSLHQEMSQFGKDLQAGRA